jgi:hypothetical protein
MTTPVYANLADIIVQGDGMAQLVFKNNSLPHAVKNAGVAVAHVVMTQENARLIAQAVINTTGG